MSFNAEEVFDKILQKSLKEKARDKMKMGKKKDDNEAEKHKEPDYLAHILKNLGYEDGAVLEEEACIAVKNESLRNLKDRLLTRAEIIQRRLEEEQTKLEEAYVSNSNIETFCRASSSARERGSTRRTRQATKQRLPRPTSAWTFWLSARLSTTRTLWRSSRS